MTTKTTEIQVSKWTVFKVDNLSQVEQYLSQVELGKEHVYLSHFQVMIKRVELSSK